MQTFDGARRHRLGASGKEAGGSCVVRRVRCRVSTFRHKARRALRERGHAQPPRRRVPRPTHAVQTGGRGDGVTARKVTAVRKTANDRSVKWVLPPRPTILHLLPRRPFPENLREPPVQLPVVGRHRIDTPTGPTERVAQWVHRRNPDELFGRGALRRENLTSKRSSKTVRRPPSARRTISP